METQIYITQDRRKPFSEWLNNLRDEEARTRIKARLNKLRLGTFGDCKSVGDGVSELRIDYGLGYRVYFAKSGNTIVLLLCGGTKKGQKSDIELAKKYWAEHKSRVKKGK